MLSETVKIILRMEQRPTLFGMLFASFVVVIFVSPIIAFTTKSSIINIQSSNYFIPLLVVRGGSTVAITTAKAVPSNNNNNTKNLNSQRMCLQSSSSPSATKSRRKVPPQIPSRLNDRRVKSALRSTFSSTSSESSLSSIDKETEELDTSNCKYATPFSSATNATTAIAIATGRRFINRLRASSKIRRNNNNNNIQDKNTESTASIATVQWSNPRVMACIYMGISMSLHYSGYEFVRNAALSLFTSDIGFPQPIAFPLMNGIISPISILLLYIYTKQLEIRGPKMTLHNFTKTCITFIATSSMILWLCSVYNGSALTNLSQPMYLLFVQNIQRGIIALMFIFNNCYVFMIASQQWSFVDSIVTPNEGAQWFGILTGISSILCTICAGIIPYILPHIGLIGMYSLTAVTLYGTLRCGDRAYTIAEQNGFDPALQQKDKMKSKTGQQYQTPQSNKAISTSKASGGSDANNSRISDAITLFRRVPTLRALLVEGISFQSLGTILNVAMIRALKVQIPDDIARSAYTGRFYASVSGISALLQFIVLPIGMKRLEPKHLWRIMPILPILVTVYQILFPFLNHKNISHLTMVAGALFITKVLDYSIRVVIYNMAYQPLDFESRFVGKEIINVFGGRVGRSGMSLLLSGLTIFPMFSSSLRPLSYFACTASTIWGISAWWLSTLLPTKADAQRTVVERRKEFEHKQKVTATKR